MSTEIPLIGRGPDSETVKRDMERLDREVPLRVTMVAPGQLWTKGETLHDRFASNAIQSLLSNESIAAAFVAIDDKTGAVKFDINGLVTKAWELANAMMSYRPMYFELIAKAAAEQAKAYARIKASLETDPGEE
mgnify:CR=1 FL=1